MICCSLLLAFACQSAEPDTQRDVITSKISEISNAFAELSGELQQVADDVSKELTVADALESAQQLADSMEELLAMLPAPPPSSSSGSPQQQPQGSGNGDQQQQPQQIEAQPQDGEMGQEEDANGSGSRPPPPQSIFQQQQQFGDWGQLPPRLEQALQHSDPNDMPLRYRRLLIRYHRQATEPER
ncbi:MAG: hypothetical protein OSB63_04000 [Planctomycetota bacterium]|nr:hypothetical protein [Planctomycetota bacterium]